jgi:hypothetical protein
VRNLLDSRRVVLWARIPSARVLASKTAATMIPERAGLLGAVVAEGGLKMWRMV